MLVPAAGGDYTPFPAFLRSRVSAGLRREQHIELGVGPAGAFQESSLDSTRGKGQFKGFTAGTV